MAEYIRLELDNQQQLINTYITPLMVRVQNNKELLTNIVNRLVASGKPKSHLSQQYPLFRELFDLQNELADIFEAVINGDS